MHKLAGVVGLSVNRLISKDPFDDAKAADRSQSEQDRPVSPSALAAVLHDLAQPLAGIRALSSAPLPVGHSAEVELKERLRQIGELGEWMNDLLGGGWATAPAEGAGSAGREGRVDAAQVIHQVLLGAVASFTGTLRWRPSSPIVVSVNASDLRRAVGNVIDNATRAAGPGGRVVVRTRRAAAKFVIDVEDSGPGFGRVPPQSRQGLAVTRQILDECRGKLEVGNGRSGGALVRLIVPIAASGSG
jgi:C4-dicarboxylate-specific signal transduction histidine kinase